MGSVFTLFPHSLHNEMAQRPVRTPSVPDVSAGMEVSRVAPAELLSPLTLPYDSDLPPLPESLSRLSLYDVPQRNKSEPSRRKSPKPAQHVGSPKQTRQSPVPPEHFDKRPTEKPPVPPRKPSSVDLKLAHLRNEMVIHSHCQQRVVLYTFFNALFLFKASLRQMDLQLLSQLRQLNDSISSYRQELIMNMDSYSSSDTDGSDTTSVYSNVTPSSLDLSRSSTQSTPKRPPTSTDL